MRNTFEKNCEVVPLPVILFRIPVLELGTEKNCAVFELYVVKIVIGYQPT
jgi:hypothetical protein